MVIIILMIVKMIYCLYYDSTRDTRSKIPHRPQEFPRASPSQAPSGKGDIWSYIPCLVLILNSGYTVKYTPSASGVPSGTPLCKGVYLTVYPSSCPKTDAVYPSSGYITDTVPVRSLKLSKVAMLVLGWLTARIWWQANLLRMLICTLLWEERWRPFVSSGYVIQWVRGCL